ncbi:inositol monophosphatase family protein [Thermosynechococcus sp. JY1334]|uniref:inositol monophosphatase family protein n=1 Tax=unclassified Thermosynechococcus TaxID=2622553 RepID=UPI0026738E2B|nr:MULTISPECIES: inositol monophosphatase family protein [unclassified Thermosynechococcus]MDR7897882.1 inositol monophosphatase family protein [Thermosynechococcus sp. JY1332]MDR7905281.1 inositol monophosphatase family protein [Thermosynechococcus sp. JY1334]MDR7922794.1 inositol monophosphatase family protein [Thermosynechococcus sp. HY213]MDR7993106.1 inositol monophosphatase family protein [Thermosynechococcus sp. TG252]WKT87494.1 inositol monophosphatase family protein [Thermosynechococc
MTAVSCPLPASERQRYLEIATEAALAGGAVLQHYWGKLSEIEEKGRSGDLVTVADRQSEAAVLDVIHRHCPDHAVLAEESGLLGLKDNPFLWAIDPLDGTTNYAHQYPFSAVSVALLVEGEPHIGVVYDPFHRELFRAATGLGATRDRQPIQVSTTAELSHSLLVTGFAYDRRETEDNNYAEFCYLTHLSQGVRRGGAAAIDLAYIACGRLDGYWERGLSPWDLAAGVVLVREAGGVVTAYDQSPFQLTSGRILATNGYLHTALSEALLRVKPLGFSFLPEGG